MGTKKTAGFTIIEVMLFLAVTGTLAVGILVGSGVAIGQQRYRDSVSSLKSFIQQQYNETTNVVNGREGEESCTNAIVVTPPAYVSSPQPRGTTDCLLLGRSIATSSDGTQVTAANVVAYRTADMTTVPLESSDTEELKHYKLLVSPIDQEVHAVAWGARVVRPKTATPEPFAMLIIHSPLSGSVMTFVSKSPQPDLDAFVEAGQSASATDVCVEPSGGSFTGQQLAIRVNPYATSQSAIEVPSESEGVCA